MFKKIVAAILCLLMLTGSIPAFTENAVGANSFTFKEDFPSSWAREDITTKIIDGKVPENLQKGFSKPITVGEYAQLRYSFNPNNGLDYLLDNVKIVDDTINENSPDYVKMAFLSGFIKSADELNITMTREEAAVRLIPASEAIIGDASDVNTPDYCNISPNALDAVGAAIVSSSIPLINNNFEPKRPFTVEQAIVGMNSWQTDRLLGMLISREMSDISKITVKKNYTCLTFPNRKYYEDYVVTFASPRFNNLEITDEHQRFDVGYCIIELNPADFSVSYTFKNNISNIDNFSDSESQPTYGVDCYKSEPRELKPNEEISLVVKPDSTHKKLYAKIDTILKKIIKLSMTQTQKVKVIHDYVVKNMYYSRGFTDVNGEEALKALETKKGVCANYAALFYYMCERAEIPVRTISDRSISGRHAWNVVYINNKWLHVDTTWDDQKSNITYDYYLKDVNYMMKTRIWSGFEYPDYEKYPAIDGMKIKNTLEFRFFLMKKVVGGGPRVFTFKLLNKSIDKDYRFLCFYTLDKYVMKYDAKKDLYTMTIQWSAD